MLDTILTNLKGPNGTILVYERTFHSIWSSRFTEEVECVSQLYVINVREDGHGRVNDRHGATGKAHHELCSDELHVKMNS